MTLEIAVNPLSQNCEHCVSLVITTWVKYYWPSWASLSQPGPWKALPFLLFVQAAEYKIRYYSVLSSPWGPHHKPLGWSNGSAAWITMGNVLRRRFGENLRVQMNGTPECECSHQHTGVLLYVHPPLSGVAPFSRAWLKRLSFPPHHVDLLRLSVGIGLEASLLRGDCLKAPLTDWTNWRRGHMSGDTTAICCHMHKYIQQTPQWFMYEVQAAHVCHSSWYPAAAH